MMKLHRIIFWGHLAAGLVVGLILSHRAAGPLYAFERFLNDHMEGKKSRLKLRTGDDFRHLEQLANRLSEEINNLPPSPKHNAG